MSSTTELSKAFVAPFNEGVVHQVVVSYLARARSGTKATKTRADVSGGGRKPWKQKGGGRARAGSIRSPIWRGGGDAHALQPRDFTKKVNRKVYRHAMASILAELVRQGRLQVLELPVMDAPSTKSFVAFLASHDVGSAYVLLKEPLPMLELSARNLPLVKVDVLRYVNPLDLVKYDRVVCAADAVSGLIEMFGEVQS